jgi:hypothetical protein
MTEESDANNGVVAIGAQRTLVAIGINTLMYLNMTKS